MVLVVGTSPRGDSAALASVSTTPGPRRYMPYHSDSKGGGIAYKTQGETGKCVCATQQGPILITSVRRWVAQVEHQSLATRAVQAGVYFLY